MTPEESERVMDLFAGALACATPAERAAFLARECAGDDDTVRAEVESLLRVQNETPDFLDKPRSSRAARRSSPTRPPPTANSNRATPWAIAAWCRCWASAAWARCTWPTT